MAATHFANGMCVSLQAPFYPAEAEKKGANASEYGLVFGIFELTVFIISPLVGKMLPWFGASKAFCCGISITGTTCIAFGFLNYIENPHTFIIFSFIVRVVEAMGNSAFLTSSFSLVAERFPNTVATVFALVEMFFGMGLILGPTLGGTLYEFGGYTMPFVSLGSLLVFQAIISTVTLAMLDRSTVARREEGEQLSIAKALMIPRVALATFAVFTASLSIGFLMATLERHLVQFGLSPIEVGIFFMAYGIAYAFPNPFWGWLADRIHPRIVILLGSCFLTVGFVFVGPLPWTGLSPSYYLTLTMIVVAGVGIGAQLVASFTESQKSAVTKGFPNDLTTYSLVSSIWTSAFALGAFVGPTAAGLLYDSVGFSWSTAFGVCWNQLVTWLTICSLAYNCIKKMRNKSKEEAYSKLVEEGNNNESTESSDSPALHNNTLKIPSRDLYKPSGPRCTPIGTRYTPTQTLFTPSTAPEFLPSDLLHRHIVDVVGGPSHIEGMDKYSIS